MKRKAIVVVAIVLCAIITFELQFGPHCLTKSCLKQTIKKLVLIFQSHDDCEQYNGDDEVLLNSNATEKNFFTWCRQKVAFLAI